MIYLPSCHSTNDIAAELVRSNSFQEGMVVITNDQTKGKGQRGTAWLTEPGQNLTFSVILKPNFIGIGQQFLISKAISVGICLYLKDYTEEAKIKWPNDIYIGDAKACGTLIENSIQGSGISTTIAGIGLNINQKEFSTTRATSLALNQDATFSLSDEFGKLMYHLDASYLRLKSASGRTFIETEYLNLLYGYQQLRSFQVGGKIKEGVISGISSTGKLCILFRDEKEPVEFDTKEIEWVWET